MEPIMLARAAYLLLFTQIAQEIGTPVRRELKRARLPTQLEDRPDAYVPVHQAMRFIRDLERREAIDDLGFLAAQRVTCSDLSRRCAELFRNASTLFDLLWKFAGLAPLAFLRFRLGAHPGQLCGFGLGLLPLGQQPF